MGVTVSLIGASSRAAASSAWRAGWRARACDLFGDVDLLQRAAHEHPSGEYPRGLAEFIHDGPDVPWMYTGGLENHPGLIEELARSRPLWGNTGATLRAVRDPFVLGGILREGGFDFPESSRDRRQQGVPYLVKPLRGSGGGHIDFAPEGAVSTPAPRGHFYQRFRSGAPYSVTSSWSRLESHERMLLRGGYTDRLPLGLKSILLRGRSWSFLRNGMEKAMATRSLTTPKRLVSHGKAAV